MVVFRMVPKWSFLLFGYILYLFQKQPWQKTTILGPPKEARLNAQAKAEAAHEAEQAARVAATQQAMSGGRHPQPKQFIAIYSKFT